jgi:predicted nucleic-acid-binding Zn-ribbon protein
MRSTQTCPKCSGHKFVVNELRRHWQDALPAVTWAVRDSAGPLGDLMRLKHFEPQEAGSFETWICLGCGYTELYACGLGRLEAVAKQYPDQLRIVDARPPEQGPYR